MGYGVLKKWSLLSKKQSKKVLKNEKSFRNSMSYGVSKYIR